ncbi:Protein of unknown function [Alkalispirochaeta americana]|uniref:DUF2997 domain-containing protein n=1 Tax=Alkalispirochaeta americana TaxID=159291 RepID=A0A1N6X7R7_9SPIO|nr:DUF2997 domain-containing protein [Alkalispirochaeta americana]SIQ98320.1 Protein of unknown function [Alkalispirochaeta americana]
MADRHELEIVIDKDGEVSIKVEGVNGSRCVQLTKDIEEELGIVVEREKTSEYYKDDLSRTNQIDGFSRGGE